MSRQITGTLKKPDGTALASTTFTLVALRNESLAVVKESRYSFATSGTGTYDVTLQNGWYAVLLTQGASEIRIGNIVVETGAATTLEALLSINGSAADPVDSALLQLVADAQTAETNAAASAAAAATSETNADTDATATAADRVQTGLDAVATAADRVQTGIDATATAADKIATNADAVATAADKVATNADAATVAADKSTVAADKQTTIDNKGYSSEWANAAEDVLVSAAAGGDQVDDYSALHHAAKAAASAALAAGGLIFKGGHDASGGTAPTTPAGDPNEKADFYKITVAGTINSIDYAVNDNIVWDTVANAWFKIDNTESVASVAGKQGVVTLVKADVGLGSVDDTSDAVKPISSATQTALDGKEPTITKKTAFNKDFGTAAGTASEGDHSHTKGDVGLGNCDNTADAVKPVSTAQAAADLDAKAGRKNHAINGCMRVWQRGTSFSADGYAADRWIFSKGGGVGTLTKLAGATGVPDKARMQMTTGGVWEAFYQKLEDDNQTLLQGKTVTVSFKCDSDTAMTGRIQFDSYFGSGGSATVYTSADFSIAAANGQTISVTVTIPTTVGKTIGAGAYTSMQIYPSKEIATTYIFDVWSVQIEENSVATDFEQRPIGEELALCQRYYEEMTIKANSYHGQYSLTPDKFYGQAVSFSVRKRAIPSITYAYVTGNQYWVIAGETPFSANSATGLYFDQSTTSWYLLHPRQAGNSTPTTGNLYIYEPEFTVKADAEL